VKIISEREEKEILQCKEEREAQLDASVMLL
jgi:hypothetical protein